MVWGDLAWFAAYYIFGVILVVGIQVRGFLAKRDVPISTVHKSEFLISSVMFRAVVWAVAPIMWPLLAWFLIQERRQRTQNSDVLPPGPEFECRPEYLARVAIIDVVERENLVFDPLGKAPCVPFGHLHAGWLAFLDTLEPEEEIWEFKIAKGQAVGKWNEPATGTRSGIAKMKAGEVVGEFVYERD